MSLDVNISEPEEFNCLELHSAIENVAKIKDVTDFSYHVDYLNGSGYIANIFRVILTENNSEETVSVIVKTLINTARKDLFTELHNREVKAYTRIIETFRKLQDSLEESKRITLPKCIYSSTKKGDEILIFEDLLETGFEVNDTLATKNKLDFSQVSLIFSELAKFHGLSFVLERHDNNFYNELSAEFDDLIFQYSFLDKSKLREYFIESFDMSLNVITDAEIKSKLEKIKPKLLNIFQDYMKPKENNVFCHGDFWLNNILFKKTDHGTKLCFLDFQAMRYANPVTDMMYFLYICTDSEFRSQHLEHLINIYYDSLTEYLSLFNIDVNNVYTREKLYKDVEDNKVLGFLLALVEIRIIAIESEDIHGDTMSGTNCIKAPNDYFRSRINDVVTESCQNGIIDKLLELVVDS